MKKLFIFSLFCLMALVMQAQRCAVLEFKAGVHISQEDVDGISAIFITYFRPAGYTMVERTQIDKVIEEQGFQRSNMTQAQMVRVGEILNVSKIVVGDINVVMGQYNVDARVINVETGTISATEGATFATSSYRTNMQSIATKLAAKIAITPGAPVKPTPSPNTASKRRSGVEVLYGYLKIFPNELGTFQAEPSTVIAQINKQAQHGYNNWRIPTNEELSLMKANNYIGSGEYMTRENRKGIVLLVSDDDAPKDNDKSFQISVSNANMSKNSDPIQETISSLLEQDKQNGPGSNLTMQYVNEVLANDPQNYFAQYGKAYVLFSQKKYDDAFDAYIKCTKIQNDKYECWYQCGLCKYKQALALNATVSSIKNQTEAKKALEKTKGLFGEAIPFFEKARECAPDEPEKWAFELRQCYSVTGQTANAAKMDKLLRF